MSRVRLTLEYDGTDFAGFQTQGKGERTVQGELEAALTQISGVETLRIHGAGRTDAGVHALGQVAHFDVNWKISEEKIAGALNAHLPRDISVRKAEQVEQEFHARFSATSRTYRYAILNRPQPSALLTRYVWHVTKPLSVEQMQEAGRTLSGTHDFATFGQPDALGKSTVRFVERISVRPFKRGEYLLVTVRGNAFLRQMVRSLVGTLVMVGQERLSVGGVEELLRACDRRACPPIAPARGLCLVNVSYDGQRIGIN
jgi:tRNA pseudouridine38-40 synthase